MGTKITKAELKQRSEELQIPFSRFLTGFIAETALSLLAKSQFGGNLWLTNGSSLGTEQYRRHNVLKLEYIYVTDEKVKKKGTFASGQTLSAKLAILMLACIVQKDKTPEIKWKGNLSAKQRDGRLSVCFSIEAEFEEMKVPLRIVVREAEGLSIQTALPVQAELPFCLGNGETISFLQYPVEERLCAKLFGILRDMELIADMGTYDEIYQILSESTIDGRQVRELLEEQCKKVEMLPDVQRAGEILSYRTYPYMQKRWERYLRQQKKQEPSWEHVMGLLEQFLPRLWNAVCADEVFFGDWMPELGRYLD